MRSPAALDRHELEEVVLRIREVLFGDQDGNLSPDKEWDAGTASDVAAVLHGYELMPAADQPIQRSGGKDATRRAPQRADVPALRVSRSSGTRR